jgi:hypothetical protein
MSCPVEHCAPPELSALFGFGVYKHHVPPGLNPWPFTLSPLLPFFLLLLPTAPAVCLPPLTYGQCPVISQGNNEQQAMLPLQAPPA